MFDMSRVLISFFCQHPIAYSHSQLGRFWWNLSSMSNKQECKNLMTFDLLWRSGRGHMGEKGNRDTKVILNTKFQNVTRPIPTFYVIWSHDSFMTWDSAQKYKMVLEPQVSPAFVITFLCNHCNVRFDPIPVKKKKRPFNPEWSLTPRLLRSHVWLYPRTTVSKSHENTSKYVDTVTLFAKTLTKGDWPLNELWPHICWGLMCDSTQESLCPSPMKIHQSMWIQWDTVTFFAKNLKGHWPLDDLWPNICWGHMCDSTEGSLHLSPMKIHQSMWIQWPFLQKLEPKVIDP